MKKSKLYSISLMSAIILSMFTIGTASAKSVRCSFENHSGTVVKYLYMSPHSYDNWGEDLLGNTVLWNGESGSFRYNNNFRVYARYYDIKVVFANGDYVTFWNIDFKGLWRLTFFWKNGSTYSIKRN